MVVAPATPADNYALLHAALASGDPVVYMEHKELWDLQGDVPDGHRVALGAAAVRREGRDLTLVTWSRTVHAALEAAEAAAQRGLAVEVIDLRTIWPWDRDAVLASAAKTRRLLVVHEAVQAGGFGAEVAATAAEALQIPVARLGAPRVPVGYSRPLEDEARVTAEKILARIVALCEAPGRERSTAAG